MNDNQQKNVSSSVVFEEIQSRMYELIARAHKEILAAQKMDTTDTHAQMITFCGMSLLHEQLSIAAHVVANCNRIVLDKLPE